MLQEFWNNFIHNLFKPLLLFFYMGFSVPLLGVPFEFPHVIYQGLTIYLLVSIGWKGGEELAKLSGGEFLQAGGFMVIGFVLNFVIGCLAYIILRKLTNLRKIDAATVAGYYGSDSAGTFVTCVGVLGGLATAAAKLWPIDNPWVPAAYMPVMLAVMEIPGCLVALFLVSTLRRQGMDPLGNAPGEPGYDPSAAAAVTTDEHGGGHKPKSEMNEHGEPVQGSAFNFEVLKEVFLNPGLFLLFGGIFIGYVSELQGEKVVAEDNKLFIDLFQGALCLFLLEMGMTACKRLRDLRTAGWPFVLFALLAPNVFATMGISAAYAYSKVLGEEFTLGTYVLFSVLCAAASYIAVPAVQRLAIPEASPTLPLAASLGVTFSYNVTIGIPVYIMIAQIITGIRVN